MRRLRTEFQEYGIVALEDNRGGKPRRKRIKEQDVSLICRLKEDVYPDFSVQHFYEKLIEKHGIEISYSWTLQILQNAGIVKNNPAVAMRTELYAGGLELANGFEELTGPKIQEERFIAEEKLRREKGKPPYPIEELFINDLKLGIPNCAGMAMGLDRLIMLLTGKEEINQVVALSPGEM
ncbi:MAG: hypothetical protein JXR91_14745 [Deltaproteobacteria bacterium]|nr:hypothetical protein [Deltaproteobacteria bacterium]